LVDAPLSSSGAIATAAPVPAPTLPRRRLATLSYREAGIIGFFQTFALLAGISRSGISMVGGLARGLSHRDAARFSFLLATPVIFAAGVLKIPSLFGPAASTSTARVLVGAVIRRLRLLRLDQVADQVLRDPHAHPVRRLQPGRGRGLHRRFA